ncbi:MAG TPA: LarC family nickel insertion protein [Alphaproteobacteria bacterium]
MQLHLDPVGGIAGDMFIAAVLDAFPEQEPGLMASLRAALGGRVAARVRRHRDAVLEGATFEADDAGESGRHGHSAADPHAHTSWAQIRGTLLASTLDPSVKREAVAIFTLLAEAEGKVHGVEPEIVAFHEVGAVDSIADIVGAAHLIVSLAATRWTVGPLPLGAGRVRTAHGLLPVPVPATVLLLQGFLTQDDGIAGERVTPTGAAIVRRLCAPAAGTAERGNPECQTAAPRRLLRSGIGFGTRTLPGISNCLRVFAFDEAAGPVDTPVANHRELAVIEFEVDDQSAEDLAMGLDRLRARESVLDVVQMPVFGKKGRMMTHVRLLARATALDDAVAACFRETTTIGLRHRLVAGAALKRRIDEVELGNRVVRVKTVERPGGRTAKAEADDLVAAASQAERARLRHNAEQRALDVLTPARTESAAAESEE